MRFDVHLRKTVQRQLASVAQSMADWDSHQSNVDIQERLASAIRPFSHTTRWTGHCGGVDGTGDFPAISYADSFVYVSVAAGALYRSDPVSGLKELHQETGPLVEFTWLTSSHQQRQSALMASFEQLVGTSVEDVLQHSDYADLGSSGVEKRRINSLIIPPAHDAGNLGIQLRTTAELAAALRLIESAPEGTLVLTDGTMSLPLAGRSKQSLFFEHLRRYCCVRARARGVVFASLSKSSGLPTGIKIEDAAKAALGINEPEHWFVRVPTKQLDDWSLFPDDGPQVPPTGAVSYLVRFHRKTPVMRLDLDQQYWQSAIATDDIEKNEQELFASLDYVSHDQRAYGYPYPIKAAHDRASLTEHERTVLRQQLVESAVQAGISRNAFRDPSQLTGHR